MTHDGGRTFREAWIAGVNKHYPGQPKPGYIASWADTRTGNGTRPPRCTTKSVPSSRRPAALPAS